MINVWQGVPRIATDLFELLPKAELDRPTAMASAQFSRHFSNRVFLLVGGDAEDSVHQAVEIVLSQLRSSGYFDQLMAKIKPSWLEEVAAFYYPYRYQLLEPRDQSLDAEEVGGVLTDRAWQRLSSPTTLLSSQRLINDPLFVLQRYLQSLPKGGAHIEAHKGYLEVHQNGRYYVLITGLLHGSVLSLKNQEKVIHAINQAIIKATEPGQVEVIRSGMIFHASAGASEARKEVSTIGLGSLLGILLLMVTVFRSVAPLLLCLLSIGAGVLVGYTVTVWLSGPVHIFTLVFGASLIGVSIDYSFHYLTEWNRQGRRWSPVRGLKHIFPGISLGLITSLLGYAPMLITPFPGLKQVALFSSFGLMASWLTVILVYPVLIKRGRYEKRDYPGEGWLTGWVDEILSFWQKPLHGINRWYMVAALIVLCSGLLLLTANDDIRQLQSRSSEQVSADRAFQDIVGDFSENRFFLVKGKDPESLLRNEEQLVRLLAKQVDSGNLRSFQAVSEFLPSHYQQQLNNKKLANIFRNQLPDFMADLSLTDDAIRQAQKVFAEVSENVMSPQAWLDGPLIKTHGHLWLGKVEGYYFSAVLLAGVSPEWNPASVTSSLDNVVLIDKTGETSGLFGRYRVLMSWLLVVAYALIGVVLFFRYGLAGAIDALLPPVLAGLMTLSLLGVLGQPINLFHILALLMVLGIGIDYTLFFKESGGENRYTLMAITLSAITTLLSFGLLALSNTAAISGFGLTVLTGITGCYILAPFAIGENRQ
ncbi:MMPL family transporter [Endozoicomonas sp. Mp262]|uniref:MMPL family transporter n=1 Tax=Endozoicomonas sp. Mp262 TaxID=2919499 RepID=UPI0021D8F9B1